MNEETMMHAIISVSIAAFVAFVLHLFLNDGDNKPKRRK